MDSGLQFDFSYGDGTSWEQMVAFETAGMMWSDYIKDDMTVNIHVEMTNTLPENVIGGALPGMLTDVNYTDFRNAYQADITSSHDQHSFDSLSIVREGSGGNGLGGTWEKFEARVDLGAKVLRGKSRELNMTRANAKALGLIAGQDNSLDGHILMNDLSNSSLEWDFNPGWTESNKVDFLSTAVHEIGHVLGFVSGVDQYEALSFDSMDSYLGHFGSHKTARKYAKNVAANANPLDLFRYSQESLDINNGRNTIDMSIGTQTYFGPAILWDAYSSGKDTSIDGDGFQASHWKEDTYDGVVKGIMDPLMKLGIERRISDRDLRAMDAIGFDLNGNGSNLLTMNRAETNWQPVTGHGTDIAILEDQAKEHIAKSVYSDGEAWWVDWWMANTPQDASFMTVDRSWEVDNMIEQGDIDIYEGRLRRNRRSGDNYRRQELFWQEDSSTVSQEYLNSASESRSDSNLDSNPTFSVIKKTSLDVIPANPLGESNSSTPSLEASGESLASISEVTVDLFILETEPELIETVSTELKTELSPEVDLLLF